MTDKNDNPFGEVIYSYTWDDAINDGVFIDVSITAKERGIKFPTAVTANLMTSYIKPQDMDKDCGQSIDGRLWDVINMFAVAAKKTPASLITFKVIFLMRGEQELVTLMATCEARSPDNPEPIITIMLPEDN